MRREQAMWERVRAWLHGKDTVVDDLILRNRARWRPGMEAVDWGTVRRTGARRWSEVARAQMLNGSTAVGGVRGTRHGGRSRFAARPGNLAADRLDSVN